MSQAVKAIKTPTATVVIIFLPSVTFSSDPPAVIITKAPQAKNSAAKATPHLSIKSIKFFARTKKSQSVQSRPEQGTKPWASAIWVVRK